MKGHGFHIAALLTALLSAQAFAAPAAVPQHPKLTSTDRAFLFDVLATNQIEIDASAYVAKHAQSPKVRQFAQQMAAAHVQLAATYQRANDGIVVTPGPSPQPGINLQGRSGAAFDQAYLTMMAGYEDQLAAKLHGATFGPSHGQAIRDMVKATLPAVRRHAEMAKTLARSLPRG